MVDAGKFAVLVVCSSIVTAMIVTIRDPLEKVTMATAIIGLVLGAVGFYFLSEGMDALERGQLICGSRRQFRHLCTRDDFDFWGKLFIYYAASVVSFTIPLMAIGSPFLAERGTSKARKRSSR